MSKKLTFHCVSGRDLLTVGLPHVQHQGAELDAVLTRLASYNRRGRLVRKKSFFIKEYSMSKKLTFHCVSGRDLLIVGLPHAQHQSA